MITDINTLQTSANHITCEDIMFEKRQTKSISKYSARGTLALLAILYCYTCITAEVLLSIVATNVATIVTVLQLFTSSDLLNL